MHIPKELITEAIQQSPYYRQYQEMVARTPIAKEGGKRKTPVKEKTSNPSSTKKILKGKVVKVRKVKSPLKLIDEDEEALHEPEHQGEETTQKLPVVKDKGKSIAIDEQAALSLLDLHKPKKRSTTDQFILQRQDPVTHDTKTGPSTQPQDDTSEKVFQDTSPANVAEKDADKERTDSDTGTEVLKVDEEQGEEISNTVTLEEKTAELDEGQAGSDPVHESLKLPTNENVLIENPLSSSGTLSSLKNLDDAYTFTTTVTITTTLPLPLPPQQQSIIDSKLASRVSALEQLCASLEQKCKLQEKITQALSSMIFMLKLQDLPHKIDQTVNEVVKEVVQIALQALLQERFRDLSEADMKEILHQRMFESGSYKSHPEHKALYKALESSMDRDNKEEFLETTAKSRKRRRDDQDPPSPPPKDSDQSKKKKHDSDTSASKQPSVQTSSAWKTSDKREAPSSSSKRKTVPQSEQPIDDVLIPDDVHISDSEDIGVAHLPKIKTRPDWLKPIPEEERPKTPEPDWVVPPNDLPEPENNWANALANSYQDSEENKLLWKTGDMGSFIKYFKQIGKKKLNKADFEDQVDLVNLEGHWVMPDVSKPLPLGGPPGQVTFQPQYFFNKDLEYLVSGDKERRNALSISKMKAAYYPDFGLEELVPSLWIESECEYDISAAYVRSHMRILSVVSLKTFSRYGYTFLREIVLRRADYKEYKISEVDFKNLHPNDFEDLYLLHLQSKLNHLSGADKVYLFNAVNLWIRNLVIRHRVEDLQLRIESYQTKLNLTQPSWDASDFQFKEDYTIVHKPRAVIYRDRNNQKKTIRETEVHKFNDGTLQRILEKLDFIVKDYKVFKFNSSMETMRWTKDDKRRSEDFIKLIEHRLKLRRIFRNQESFVSGRLRDVDYRLITRTE
ncbi:hypothetical protein Tco_0894094 [Tanacetum coccineum]|uniref:Ubinuclein middle domain-containing protein n=1 Tax=Tanacetum coccineum TaxID=301880 RepID=A0ABQ5CC94_9ASTR